MAETNNQNRPMQIELDEPSNGPSGDNVNLVSDGTRPKQKQTGGYSPYQADRAAEALLNLNAANSDINRVPLNSRGNVFQDRYVPRGRANQNEFGDNQNWADNLNSSDPRNRQMQDNSDINRRINHSLHDMQTRINELQNNRVDTPIHQGQRRPKVMPDSFDGRGSWSQYLAHFETVSDLNGWNVREKSQYLSVSLRGEACQVIQFLPVEQRRNYDDLIEAMNKRFDPGHNVGLFRVQLRTKARKERESIPQLAQSVRALATQAYPTADQRLFDSLCCDHFIDAMQDDDLKMRLLNSDSERFDDVVALAIKYEACVQARKLKQNKRYVREIQPMHDIQPHGNDMSDQVFQPQHVIQQCSAIQNYQRAREPTELEKLQAQLNTLTKLVGDLAQKEQDKSQRIIKCYHCGKPGHKRPDCPDRLQAAAAAPAQTKPSSSN